MTTPTHADLSRDFYRLEGRVTAENAALRERMEKLERAVEAGFSDMGDKIDKLVLADNARATQGKTVSLATKIGWGVISAAIAVGWAVFSYFHGK